ncbi:RDD family protein [Streptomyces sp. NPDC085932]|uniref:RDD family protein n=1 Tax=Streptomyces sp. NPDC085932 TaxID=3365741 RepID=UPI0037D5FFE2
MSAPTPAPGDDRPREGYYPDPSIPGYVRYWNGVSWVPGTSRPAPGDGESLAPPPGAGAAPAASVEETGPHFFDEDPVDEPAPADAQHGSRPEPASAWGADRSRQSGFGGDQDRRVSWGAPQGAQAAAAQQTGAARAGDRQGADPRVAPADRGPAGDSPRTDGTASIAPADREANAAASGSTFVFRRPSGTSGGGAAAETPDEGTMTFRAVPPRTGGPQSGPQGGHQGGGPRSGHSSVPPRPGGPESGLQSVPQGGPRSGPQGGAKPGGTGPGAQGGAPGTGGSAGAQGPGAAGAAGAPGTAGSQGSSTARGPAGASGPAGSPGSGPGGGTAGPGFGPAGSADGGPAQAAFGGPAASGSASAGSGFGGQTAPAASGGGSGFGAPAGVAQAPAGPAFSAQGASAGSADGGNRPGFAAGKAAAARAAAAQASAGPVGAQASAAGSSALSGPQAAPTVPPQPGGPQSGPAASAATPLSPGPGGGQSSWAQQVHRLAGAGGGEEHPVAPWKPPVEDVFQAAARRQASARPAGLGKRLVARLVDSVVLLGLTAAAAVPLGIKAVDHVNEKIDAARLSGETVTVWLLDGTTSVYLGIIVAVLLLAGFLSEVLPTAKWGRTLGKRLMGLDVRDIEGHDTPELGAALRRWLVYSVPGLLVVGVVGVAWCLFDKPWRQCWHDKAAHTFVAG